VGKNALELNVHGAICSWGEMFMRQNVHEANVHGAKCSWGKNVHGAKCS
jgi:hypothetical protein